MIFFEHSVVTLCWARLVLGMEELRQASVELVGTADHMGCGVQHLLQFLGRSFRHT